MADLPGRSDFESDDRAGGEDDGWGSPVPAQYGSLRSVRAPGEPGEHSDSAPERMPADREDRWGVSSLLRRLQGGPVLSDRSPVDDHQPDGASADGPRPDGSSPPSKAAQSQPGQPGRSASGARVSPDRLTASPEVRRVRWYDDPPAPIADGNSPTAPAEPDRSLSGEPSRSATAKPLPSPADSGGPAPGIADTAALSGLAAAAVAGAPVLPVGPTTESGTPAGASTAPSMSAGAPTEPVVSPAPAPGPGPAVGEPAATAAGINPAALGPGLTDPDVLLGGRRRRRRPGRTRTRATVRHLDLGTVIRVSLVFWLLIVIALVVASLLLWLFADAFGSLPSIEKSVRTLFSLKSFQLHPGTIAVYTAAGGVVIAVAGLLGTIVFALIYNLIADVVGGIRVELESFSAE